MAVDPFTGKSTSSKKAPNAFASPSVVSKHQKALANADQFQLTDPQTLAKQQQAQQKSSTSKGIGKVLHAIGSVGKTAAQDTFKAGKALARPIGDLATGQGQKAIHDALHNDTSVGQVLFSHTGKFINQGVQEAKQVGDTVRMGAANLTHNPTAFGHAEAQSNKDYEGFKNSGGLFNAGTITTKQEAKQGTGKAALKVAAGTAAVAPEIIPLAGAGEAAAAGGEAASNLSRGQKVAQAATKAAKVGGLNALLGTVSSVADQFTGKGKVSAKQTAKDTAVAGGMGLGAEALGYGVGLLGKAFDRGAAANLKELENIKAQNEQGQKLLSAGEKAPMTNDSTAPVPKTTQLSQKEFTDRFNSIKNSYSKETDMAKQITDPAQQRIALDDAHDRHVQALEQLNSDYLHGKANPDYAPGKTTPTGFTVQTPGMQAKAKIATDQRAALHQRVGQIDKIVSDAQQNGSARSPQELRSLMQERQVAQDVLDGKVKYEDAYGKPGKPGELNQLPFEKQAAKEAPKTVPVASTAPAFLHAIPKAAVGDTKAAPLARNFIVSKYQQSIRAVQDVARGMSKHDIQLIDTIEGGHTDPAEATAHLNAVIKQADNPSQFKKVVGLMREGYNARLANDTALGREVGQRNNYLAHYFDRTDAATANKLDELQAQKAHLINGAQPGYTKPRTIENYALAKELGLKRANNNSLQDFYQAMNAAGYEHGSQALKQKLEEAHPGQVHVGEFGRGADGQRYNQLKIQGGENLSLPEKLAAKYNARAPYEYKDSALGKSLRAYDAANAGIKYAKLGGGLFHSFTTAGTTLGHQIASLNLLKHPVENLRVVAGTLSDTVHKANLAKLAADQAHNVDNISTADRMALSGVTTSAKDILGDANVKALDKVKGSKFNVLKDMHDMVFDRQIPESKALIFKQATRGLDSRIPADLEKMRAAARAVNNMGGINRAVDGLTYGTAKQLSRAVLATDFTEGKFRTLFSALAKGGPEGKIARRMVVGKSLLFALPGLTAAVASGKLNPSDPKAIADELGRQILNPSVPLNSRGAPTKSNPQGTPQSAKLPATFISELGKVIQPALDSMNPDRLSGVKDYASSRLAALPSTAEQLATNTDYFGNPIYGTDKSGNPISPATTAKNVANQVLPIPAVQAGKTAEGTQGLGTAGLNTVGFRVSSDPNSPEAQHSKALTDFFNTYNTQYSARAKVTKQINSLVLAGKVNQAARVANDWNSQVDARLTPFRSKYANGYDKDWDTEFKKLFIPVSDRAFKARLKSSQQSQALLR